MKTLLNPIWIIILNSFPLIVLSIFLFNDFLIIKSLLNTESLNIWFVLTSILVVLFLFSLVSSIFFQIKKMCIPLWFSILSLIMYVVYAYCYYCYGDELVPFNIPNWMISGNLFFYLGTFLMPTFIHSILVSVITFTNIEKKQSALLNFVYTITVPIFFYVFSQICIPLADRIDDKFGIHAILITIISATIVFLFFLFKCVYILAIKKEKNWTKYQIIWKITICLIFPVLGLLINNGELKVHEIGNSDSGIFGNFSSFWFYFIAIINGILLCIPNLENKIFRLFVYLGRSITFSYTLYFFFVFIPFLPVSIIAIIGIGVGFLMLTPIVLSIIHVSELTKDYIWLKQFISYKKLLLSASIGFILIPSIITISFIKDRRTLTDALDYVYNPDFSKEYNIDKASLNKTISTVYKNKNKHDKFIFGENLPYINTYFKWIVLDNLTISDSKLNYLEQIFFNKEPIQSFTDNQISTSNFTTNTRIVNCKYDKINRVWVSTVELTIKNNQSSNSEFSTTFNLPEGALISNYYLYIGNKKENGILAEKKTALWVYNNIVNENKDPGIIYYTDKNTVKWNVFPFLAYETRKTGIELIHKEPITVAIDGTILQIGEENLKISKNTNEYISSIEKKKLTKVKRIPYYHFILDFSENKKGNAAKYSKIIRKIIAENPISNKSHKVSLVNSSNKTILLNSNLEKQLKTFPFEGGFFLDRGIKTVLFETFKNRSKNTYPIIITISDSIENAIIENNFSNYTRFLPESEFFYNYSKNNFEKYSLCNNSKKSLGIAKIELNTENTLLYKSYNYVEYLKDNNQGSIVFNEANFYNKADNKWEIGIDNYKKWLVSNYHPENYKKSWLEIVQNSFKTGILNPYTSYLVVENEAQKEVLKQKQKLVLSGNKSLDLDEDTPRMSEPNEYYLLLLIITIFIFLNKQKRAV